MPVPRTGRSGVSAAFEGVLARAMAKNPTDRYDTAMEFARALQHVQIGLGLADTPIDVEEDELLPADDSGEERATRFRGITQIEAQNPVQPVLLPIPAPTPTVAPTGPSTSTVGAGTSTVRAAPSAVVPRAHVAAPPAPPLSDTVLRPVEPPAVAESSVPQRRRRTWLPWTLGAAALAVGAAVSAGVVLAPSGVADPAASPPAARPIDAEPERPAQVTDLVGVSAEGAVTFVWSNPAPADGDVYLWRQVVPGQEFRFTETAEPTASVAPDASGRACIEVLLRRADGSSSDEGVEGCAP